MNVADEYQYIVAWSIYCLAGIGCCVFWWKVTSFIGSGAWRDIFRGMAAVVIFTPWYAGNAPELYAPAIVVLLMDLLLEGAKSGMKGGVALLASSFLMLLFLTIKQFMRNKPRDV